MTHFKCSPGSLTQRVAEFVKDSGQASLSKVRQAFPEYTKKQVHDALSNAQYRRQIKVIFRGNYRGKTESVWAQEFDRPKPASLEKPKGPVASVWQLGTPEIETWPPAFEGGREFRLLGPWDAEENDTRQAA